MNPGVRSASEDDIGSLATIWFDGWRDGHAEIVPAELIEDRTRESFEKRLGSLLPQIRVVGAAGDPLGFAILKDDEVYQFYVSARARGKGVAAQLMQDAEGQMSTNGVTVAWLACAIGNDRAARFYQKSGWRRVGVMDDLLETTKGPFVLEVWRYEKELPQVGSQ